MITGKSKSGGARARCNNKKIHAIPTSVQRFVERPRVSARGVRKQHKVKQNGNNRSEKVKEFLSG